jgi:glycosyltransferase involved in cell wall biosynthesis
MLSVGIPIYKPNVLFFDLISKLVSQHPSIEQYIIFETVDDFAQENSFELLQQLFRNTKSSLVYEIILKDTFHHSRTRNQIVTRSDTEYILFITQDIILGNVDIANMLEAIDRSNIDAGTVRHQPINYAFSKIWELMFANIAFAQMNSGSISWWSNNFAIYRVKTLLKLPFPDFSFAEDYYWTRIANGMGFKLKYFMSESIRHLNQDSIDTAKKRGSLEAQAAYEAARYFGDPTHKIPRVKSLIRIVLMILRYEFRVSRLNLFFEDFSMYSAHLAQNFSRIQTWNALVKGKR